MDRLILFIATGFGSGYLPVAPGTWGSLVGVIMWFALRDLSLLPYLGVTAAIFVVGTFCAGSAEKTGSRWATVICSSSERASASIWSRSA